MSPIDWGAHNGELVEQVASVMLLQTHPKHGGASHHPATQVWT